MEQDGKTDKKQDMFLYGVIVPVIPFALQQRSHVAQDRGKRVYKSSGLCFLFSTKAYNQTSPILGLCSHRHLRRRLAGFLTHLRMASRSHLITAFSTSHRSSGITRIHCLAECWPQYWCHHLSTHSAGYLCCSRVSCSPKNSNLCVGANSS